MDDVFSFGSKAIIVIPIVIVIIALIFKFNSSAKISQTVNNFPTPTLSQSPQFTQNNSFKFDLTGPIVCQNLFIHNKKIFYKNNLSSYLLNGDCLYQWKTGQYNGEKKCGLSGYISLAENYTGMFNVSDLVSNSMLTNLAKSKGVDLENVIQSCKKESIKDETVFTAPLNVLFKTQ